MPRETAFIEISRIDSGTVEASRRVQTWKEFVLPPSEDVLRQQASRCMDCGVPFCHAVGCPLGNLIPELNDAVSDGDWRAAWDLLECTNNFPEITGRVCPASCEAACALSVNSQPVTIRQLERAIVEHAFKMGWVTPRPPKTETGKSVAVIGSGPAGLAAAQQLRRAGHAVTVYEQAPKPGGLLRYGIPDFKLEKRVLDRRIEQLEAEGVRFVSGATVGRDVPADGLRAENDAILLAVGASEPRDLPVPGRELEGIYFAMDFLAAANLFVEGKLPRRELIDARDRDVLVIGGGDTGADCVGTANRLGARSVRQIEILPRPPDHEGLTNPAWPRRPNVLRTTSSHEEGCEREWAVQTTEFLGVDGRVAEAELVPVEWVVTEPGGRRAPKPVAGTGQRVETDLVLLALGFLHTRPGGLLRELGFEMDGRGNILADDFRTTADGIFTAGDATTGPSLVVNAVDQGRRAAAAIDRYFAA